MSLRGRSLLDVSTHLATCCSSRLAGRPRNLLTISLHCSAPHSPSFPHSLLCGTMDAATQFALDQQLRPQPPPATPAVPLLTTTPAKQRLTVHHWSDRYLNKIPLHATFIFLHSSVYIYLSLSSLPHYPLSSLAFSMHDGSAASIDAVSTTTLLSSATGQSSMSSSLSARLSRQLSLHCMASVNVSDEEALTGVVAGGTAEDEVQLWIERRVMQELKACKATGMWVTS